MIVLLKEIFILILSIYAFLVLRSHFSKGESIKEALFNNLGYVVAVLFSPVTWFALFLAAVYVAYQIIH